MNAISNIRFQPATDGQVALLMTAEPGIREYVPIRAVEDVMGWGEPDPAIEILRGVVLEQAGLIRGAADGGMASMLRIEPLLAAIAMLDLNEREARLFARVMARGMETAAESGRFALQARTADPSTWARVSEQFVAYAVAEGYCPWCPTLLSVLQKNLFAAVEAMDPHGGLQRVAARTVRLLRENGMFPGIEDEDVPGMIALMVALRKRRAAAH